MRLPQATSSSTTSRLRSLTGSPASAFASRSGTTRTATRASPRRARLSRRLRPPVAKPSTSSRLPWKPHGFAAKGARTVPPHGLDAGACAGKPAAARKSFAEGLSAADDVNDARNKLLAAQIARRVAAYRSWPPGRLLNGLAGTMHEFESSIGRSDNILER